MAIDPTELMKQSPALAVAQSVLNDLRRTKHHGSLADEYFECSYKIPKLMTLRRLVAGLGPQGLCTQENLRNRGLNQPLTILTIYPISGVSKRPSWS